MQGNSASPDKGESREGLCLITSSQVASAFTVQVRLFSPIVIGLIQHQSFIRAAALITQEPASPSCEGVKMSMQTGVKRRRGVHHFNSANVREDEILKTKGVLLSSRRDCSNCSASDRRAADKQTTPDEKAKAARRAVK